jgi:hypothetical protein
MATDDPRPGFRTRAIHAGGRPDPATGARAVPIHAAAASAAEAGPDVVQDRCLEIEPARFAGGLHTAGFDTGVIDSRRRGPM